MKRRNYRGRRADRALDIEDLRCMARRRLPGFVCEYLEGGAEDEATLKRNRESFSRVRFVHQGLNDTSTRDVSGEIFGKATGLPCAIAPTGFNGLLWRHADLALARAAKDYNIPFTVSTASSDSLERIAKDVGGRLWFQLYVLRDQAAVDTLISRADEFGCEALVTTVDAPILGNRTWDRRNFSAYLKLTLRAKIDVLAHVRWLFGVYLPRGLPGFGTIAEFVPARLRSSPLGGAQFMGENVNAGLGWDDMARLRDRWPRKLILKGLVNPEEIERAAEIGVDAVVLGNHGGRQLDHEISGLDALPLALQAAGSKMSVFVDGGIRRGTDIAKAIALGADAVLLGRATLYGVAAAGEAGARRALEIFSQELDQVAALLGCPTIRAIGSDFLWPLPGRDAATDKALPNYA